MTTFQLPEGQLVYPGSQPLKIAPMIVFWSGGIEESIIVLDAVETQDNMQHNPHHGWTDFLLGLVRKWVGRIK